MHERLIENQRRAPLVCACALIVFAAMAFGCSAVTDSLSKGEPWNGAGSPNGAASIDLSTPTKAYAAYRQAVKTGDLNLYKKVVSKGILDIKAEKAKKQNKSLDDFLKDEGKPYVGDNDQSFDEAISGDKATLEVGADKSSAGKLDFVKEADGWKMDSRSRRDER